MAFAAEAWLAEIGIAAAMSQNRRLGADSGLGSLSADLLRIIVAAVRDNTGIQCWRWLHSEDDKSLVSFTSLRHREHGTTVQLAHSRSTGITFSASDMHDQMYAFEGEILRAHYTSAAAIRMLQEGEGELVPHGGISAGPWRIELLGPDVQITREDAPTQSILLTGDGFEMTPATPAVHQLLGLPSPAGFKATLTRRDGVYDPVAVFTESRSACAADGVERREIRQVQAG